MHLSSASPKRCPTSMGIRVKSLSQAASAVQALRHKIQVCIEIRDILNFVSLLVLVHPHTKVEQEEINAVISQLGHCPGTQYHVGCPLP